MRHILTGILILACVQVSFGQLSGPLWGTYGPGTYTVVGDIQVNADCTLVLAPATTFNFQGAYYFRVYGRLFADGTEESLIVFTTDQSGTNRWRGIRFESGASSGSHLVHCLIEKGYARGTGVSDGGGVCCFRGAPSFAHCTIRNCRANRGGGAFISSYIPQYTNASPSFTECVFVGDSALPTGLGGGVECMDSASFANCRFDSNTAYFGGGADMTIMTTRCPYFSYCSFTANTGVMGGGAFSDWNTSFAQCVFTTNQATTYSTASGGGVEASGGGRFTNCVISGNSALGEGGGASCGYSSTFINCVISGNATSNDGGGVSCASGYPAFTNCTISGNSGLRHGGGVYCSNSTATFKNTIISFSTGCGIYFATSPGSQFAHCNIFGNSGGNIVNPSQGSPGIGELVITNANEDSCDIYDNIFLDPMFVDTALSNFHLTDLSHCIGAGDTTDIVSTDFDGNPRPNPPGSNPDIGAYENSNGVPGGAITPVSDLVIRPDFPGSGNMILYWSPVTGASYYNIYGAQAPYVVGTLLATGVVGTTWTDINTSSRPSPYFYFVTAVQ